MNVKKILIGLALIGLNIICGMGPVTFAAAEKSDVNESLLSACETGDLALVTKLLAQGGEVNAKNDNDETALMLACSNGQLAVAALLLEQGAKVNERDIWDGTALHRACDKNYFEIATLLVGHDANLALKNNSNETPLLAACSSGSYQIVKFLLAKGADVRVRHYQTRLTALHMVSEAGYDEAIRWLLAKGADLNALDSEGKTPLHHACAQGQESTVQMLIESGAQLDIQDYMGASLLHEACKAGQLKLVMNLILRGLDINIRDRNGKTPLHYACSAGKKNLVERLLKLGADGSATDESGGTAMHHAAYHGQVEVAKLLFAHGIAIGTPDKQGLTPLDLANRQNQQRMVQWLTAQGARKASVQKTVQPYCYQNYQINKKPVIIRRVKSRVTNTHSSFWNETQYPNLEQLAGSFEIYVEDWTVNRERIKEVTIWSDESTKWHYSREELEFEDGHIGGIENLTAGSLAKDHTLFALTHFRVEIVTFDGRVDCYLVNTPEPGSLNTDKTFVYTPGYRGPITPNHVAALQTGKVVAAKLTGQGLNLQFKVEDSRVSNGMCLFFDSHKQFIAFSRNWVNRYSLEVSQYLNDGRHFYTNGQVNCYQIGISEIEFNISKSAEDIQYVMLYLSDGGQFWDSEEPNESVHESRSMLVKVERIK